MTANSRAAEICRTPLARTQNGLTGVFRFYRNLLVLLDVLLGSLLGVRSPKRRVPATSAAVMVAYQMQAADISSTRRVVIAMIPDSTSGAFLERSNKRLNERPILSSGYS